MNVVVISGNSTITPLDLQSVSVTPSYPTTVFKAQNYDLPTYQIVSNGTTTFSATDSQGNPYNFYVSGGILYFGGSSYQLSQGQTLFLANSSSSSQAQMSSGVTNVVGNGNPTAPYLLPAIASQGSLSLYGPASGHLLSYTASNSYTGPLTYVSQNDVPVTPELRGPWQATGGSQPTFSSSGAVVNWSYNTSNGVSPTQTTIQQVGTSTVYPVNPPTATTYVFPGTFTPGTNYCFVINTSANGKTTSSSNLCNSVAPLPVTITSMSAVWATDRVNVSWAVSSQQGYNGATVAWDNGQGDSGSHQVSSSNFSDSLFLKGGLYKITVSTGDSSQSQSLTVPGTLPSPSEVIFSVRNDTEGQATVSWTYPDKYYANSASFSAAPTDNSYILMKQPAELSPSVRSYSLTGLKPNVSYSYILTLGNTLASTNYPGQPFVAVSPPPALSELKAEYLSGQVTLSWTVSPPDARPPWFTEVQVVVDNQSPETLVQAPTATQAPPSSGTLSVGTGSHIFNVFSVGQGGKGPLSNTASLIIPGDLPGNVTFTSVQQQGDTLNGKAVWIYNTNMENITEASLEVDGTTNILNPQTTSADFEVKGYGTYPVTLTVGNGVEKKSFSTSVTFSAQPVPPNPNPQPVPPNPNPQPPVVKAPQVTSVTYTNGILTWETSEGNYDALVVMKNGELLINLPNTGSSPLQGLQEGEVLTLYTVEGNVQGRPFTFTVPSIVAKKSLWEKYRTLWMVLISAASLIVLILLILLLVRIFRG